MRVKTLQSSNKEKTSAIPNVFGIGILRGRAASHENLRLGYASPKKLETELCISCWEGVPDRAECCYRPGKLIRGIEVRTVEGVVHLCPELESRNLSKPPILLNRQVPVLVARRAKG